MLWSESRRDASSPQEISLGDFVEVRGKLEWSDKIPVVSVESHEVSTDPHAEFLWWVDLKHTYETAYTDKFKITLSADTETSLSQRYNT